MRENIFYKFGYPTDLVTDQGSHFTSNLIEDTLTHHIIKHRTSTPYHPQENGTVEVFNKILETALTKICSVNRDDRDLGILAVLWAYRTTCKKLITQTPFKLV